jgi:hypothetical protein
MQQTIPAAHVAMFEPAATDARYCVVYFDCNLVALGTDRGDGAYSGDDWMTTEAMHVQGDPTGKHFLTLRDERAAQLRAIGRGEPPAAEV